MKTIYFVTVLCVASIFTSSAYGVKQVELLKRDGKQNEIPLLDNRFRIDSNLDKITLLIFREPGSPAVVLVRPDGSKYLVSELAKNLEVDWYDEISYDIVSIKNPMPGPWQAIGRIRSNSRVIALGKIDLEVQAFPSLIFRGETIKVTGQILNDGELINADFFKDVVNLDLSFISTNKENYANFGAGREDVATYKDDGYDLDERARDGVFTGELTFSFPAGEWTPVLSIITPLLERQIVQNPLIVHEPPLSYDIELGKDGDDHLLTINIDNTMVDPATVIIQGKIYYPNNEEQMFVIDAVANQSRQLSVKNYDWGRYNIELSIFGTNINGREFMATLPTYKFEVARPIEVIPEIEIPAISEPEIIIQSEPEEEKMTAAMLTSLIVGCNLLILLIGWLSIRVFVQKKPIKFNVKLPFLKKKKVSEDKVTDSGKNQLGKNGSKNDKSGEILNLSMSDD
ncbi:TIGR03503 family protein [Pseudoalteromonas sp. SG45-5]|uniref:TIGR03503 family protein n=1 Tax=unclassified Pseudoalteromonas TaxID=194690 RepID=UPI0015FD42C5|nr:MULTISPECIES: TIGR03503 family protein [unclassified Pseudoalteromonas]MBB1387592.1 TIGR03503 family protein [Pseudoalteromonas sp. SG45-5]MBB1395827.1 TIGR03503 family protein [Pseudoalteromonas sp. SG44-4]MBB1448867.1 TIGR03503 family protein [Pseudoalteromonas sp. SG41-6]